MFIPLFHFCFDHNADLGSSIERSSLLLESKKGTFQGKRHIYMMVSNEEMGNSVLPGRLLKTGSRNVGWGKYSLTIRSQSDHSPIYNPITIRSQSDLQSDHSPITVRSYILPASGNYPFQICVFFSGD